MTARSKRHMRRWQCRTGRLSEGGVLYQKKADREREINCSVGRTKETKHLPAQGGYEQKWPRPLRCPSADGNNWENRHVPWADPRWRQFSEGKSSCTLYSRSNASRAWAYADKNGPIKQVVHECIWLWSHRPEGKGQKPLLPGSWAHTHWVLGIVANVPSRCPWQISHELLVSVSELLSFVVSIYLYNLLTFWYFMQKDASSTEPW